MILVDTSVWVAHFKGMSAAQELVDLLENEKVFAHPHVIGELVLDGLGTQPRTLLQALPAGVQATNEEVLYMVDELQLAGRGIGWFDVHLLASARLSGATLWTLDESLASVARDLGL